MIGRPMNAKYGTLGRPVKVLVNFFKVDLRIPSAPLVHYDVRFSKDVRSIVVRRAMMKAMYQQHPAAFPQDAFPFSSRSPSPPASPSPPRHVRSMVALPPPPLSPSFPLTGPLLQGCAQHGSATCSDEGHVRSAPGGLPSGTLPQLATTLLFLPLSLSPIPPRLPRFPHFHSPAPQVRFSKDVRSTVVRRAMMKAMYQQHPAAFPQDTLPLLAYDGNNALFALRALKIQSPQTFPIKIMDER
ncbi:unnamed protein product [Closterium sp. NIES-64]|nr:unnamed protein product [Closterium sp. NIES-64]